MPSGNSQFTPNSFDLYSCKSTTHAVFKAPINRKMSCPKNANATTRYLIHMNV